MINALFNPENIAIIGASGNPSKAGYVILNNLLKIKYPKKIFPVNIKEDKILGLKSYDNINDIEDTVDILDSNSETLTLPVQEIIILDKDQKNDV